MGCLENVECVYVVLIGFDCVVKFVEGILLVVVV